MGVRTKLFIATTLVTLFCACDASTGEALEQREGLLFGLTQDDVQELHDRYVPEEEIELTTARLTAPFDCALYDDLCDQVSREDAIAFTAELVDLGLAGATEEEIEEFSDGFLDEAMDALADEDEKEDEDVFRSSSPWVNILSGGTRLRVRTGITTPFIGRRHAWTEVNSHSLYNGSWRRERATILCATPGTSTQAYEVCGGGSPCSSGVFESLDDHSCGINVSTWKHETTHDRRSGSEYPGGFYSRYRLTSRGSGSMVLPNGIQTVGTGLEHVRIY